MIDGRSVRAAYIPPSPQPGGATEGGVYIVYARGAVKHVGHTDFPHNAANGQRPSAVSHRQLSASRSNRRNRNFHRNIVFSSTASRTMISDGRTPSLKSGPFLVEEEFQRARKPSLYGSSLSLRLVQLYVSTRQRGESLYGPPAFRVPLARTGDASFKCLPYQLSMVVSATTMVVTGNGESGFDSGEEPEKRLPHPRKAAGAQITHSRHGELHLCAALSVHRTRGATDTPAEHIVGEPFRGRSRIVGGAICLVNSGNERDSSLLNRRRHSGVRGVRVARLTGGVIKIFLEGPAASSRTRLSNNRSVMPLDVLGRTRATLKESACSPGLEGQPSETPSCWGLAIVIDAMNEEFPVSTSHQLVLITSLPFVHTARRYYRLNDLVRSSDRHAVALSAVGVAGKLTKLDHLEEDHLSEGRPYITKATLRTRSRSPCACRSTIDGVDAFLSASSPSEEMY
ncbi:hypothetical protein EVAR_47566_1 [Eumeta japonica]|uniref:Uncharacterized protein n=1 Tax=Eumeta variegata TaxID=151549 RepID=A0A4C1WNP8_EUMVA|nr:hypothetical protein EVAR_47566_1 [Eumeta japonica]